MEPVLRSIELATNMTNNTDLNALLALRLEGGHLPQADLGGPHPFRGSAPGERSMPPPALPPHKPSWCLPQGLELHSSSLPHTRWARSLY